MNGNISADGAKLDLAWMKAIGLGGVQLVEGDLGTPRIVPKRVVFLSAPWKDALRASVSTAERLGLEFAISTAPGWSATGGPWVAPADAMQKLVWSDLVVDGGSRLTAPLPHPPISTGPYQDVPLSAVDLAASGRAQPSFYRDGVVLAFPISPAAALPEPLVDASMALTGDAALRDDLYANSVPLKPSPTGKAWVRYAYPKAVTVRRVRVGLAAPVGFGAAPPGEVALEASDDGIRFRPVSTLPASTAPVRTASFPPVTAQWFRLVLTVPAPTGAPPLAAGVILPFPPPAAPVFQLSEFSLSADTGVSRAPEKAGFSTVPDYRAIDTGSAAIEGIAPKTVLDVTSHLRPDGRLDWTPPPGRWKILRLGTSLTGHRNGPAPAEATGLEVDKLSPRRVAAYLDTYLGLYRDTVGAEMIGRRGIRALLADSIESGPQNWTDTMIADFTRLRGYDPRPWLPALTGEIVGDAAASDRFLYDFRRTVSDLLAAGQFATIAAKAKAAGLITYSEALEDHRPQLGDDLDMRSFADVPTGAMWQFPAGGQPRSTLVADAKGAASVAHLYGRPIAAAETFTSFGAPYAAAPRDLKATADEAFSLGINRLLIHTSPHQPLTGGQLPGMTLAPYLGQYFSRNETWAGSARSWIDYLSRSSFLLQQGRPHADVLYFYGEEAPITALFGDSGMPAGIPVGYDFDFVNARALRERITVDDGALTTPAGNRYALVLLGGSSRAMTLATVKRLEKLVRQGATVAGPKPDGDPSNGDDPAAWRRAVDQLWGSSSPISRHGAGFVYPDLESALRGRHQTPDWIADTSDIAVLHRSLERGELYFVSERGNAGGLRHLSFRATGVSAKILHADTGRVEQAGYRRDGDRTVVDVPLDAGDAVFVLLRPNTDGPPRRASEKSVATTLAKLDTNWTLQFQQERGAPLTPIAANIGSWTSSPNAAIRYFSGVATYTRMLNLEAGSLGADHRLLLDLGDVRELADVEINGRSFTTLWKPPFRLDVTDALHPGQNQITVKITNLWVNRLIGDAQPGAEHVTQTDGPTYRADAPLRPSGLLGPVKLVDVQETVRSP